MVIWPTKRRATTRRWILGEATISATGPELIELITAWTSAERNLNLPIGTGVRESLLHASELRRQVAANGQLSLDLNDPGKSADLLYAVCRILEEGCADSPETTLRDAAAFRKFVDGIRWSEDEFGEREGLLCALTFICWRSARILGLSLAANRWEFEYRRVLQGSLDWEGTQEAWVTHRWSPAELSVRLPVEGEDLLRILLYLQDRSEYRPEVVASNSITLYDYLRSANSLPSDVHSYLLGTAARIGGSTLGTTGRLEEAAKWIGIAEAHFRSGVDPEPQLARVLFHRLRILYEIGRVDLVAQFAPSLDRQFADFGMDEDRVKCRILWSASLKTAGRPEHALEILDPVREVASCISSHLYGWVLQESGDLRQICGDFTRGREELMEAGSIFKKSSQLTGLANVNSIIAAGYRAQGKLAEAIGTFRASKGIYACLGMKTYEAYVEILIAETYLAMGCHREAEREILKALPSIEEQGMIADAVAAVSILREAVRRRNLDPQVLREVTERLRPKK